MRQSKNKVAKWFVYGPLWPTKQLPTFEETEGAAWGRFWTLFKAFVVIAVLSVFIALTVWTFN